MLGGDHGQKYYSLWFPLKRNDLDTILYYLSNPVESLAAKFPWSAEKTFSKNTKPVLIIFVTRQSTA
jgi:hypothetical protein